MFASTEKNDVWVMLLEKALAKIYSGYWNLDGLEFKDVIFDITGCPQQQIQVTKSDLPYIWKDI